MKLAGLKEVGYRPSGWKEEEMGDGACGGRLVEIARSVDVEK